jgi:hypothetical protein
MSEVLSLFPSRVRFVDANGMLTPEALRALSVLFTRVGGAISPSITDLAVADDEDSGLEEMRHEFTKSVDGLAMAPALVLPVFDDQLQPLAQQHSEVQALQTEIAGLREEVASLRTQVNDIQQGTML